MKVWKQLVEYRWFGLEFDLRSISQNAFRMFVLRKNKSHDRKKNEMKMTDKQMDVLCAMKCEIRVIVSPTPTTLRTVTTLCSISGQFSYLMCNVYNLSHSFYYTVKEYKYFNELFVNSGYLFQYSCMPWCSLIDGLQFEQWRNLKKKKPDEINTIMCICYITIQ